MKITLLILLLCSTYTLRAIADESISAELVTAESIFTPGNSVAIVGRGAITHLHGGNYAASNHARETHIMQIRQTMEDEILGVKAYAGHGDTPPIEFISEYGVNEQYVFHTIGNGPTQSIMKVSNVQKSAQAGEGFLNGTLMLPASGHTGAANARLYAASDTYSVTYSISSDAAGKQFSGAEKSLIKDTKSLGFVTLHEVSIPMIKGHVTRIFYYRSGSGGPGGYYDGRVIDFIPTDAKL